MGEVAPISLQYWGVLHCSRHFWRKQRFNLCTMAYWRRIQNYPIPAMNIFF